MNTVRAAHFLRNASLIGTPPTDAIVSAYRELNFEVDLYAPDVQNNHEGLGRFSGGGVNMLSFSYSKKWLLKNVWRLVRQRYRVISANAEDPVGVAAPLAKLSRCPLIVSADEIFSGSYYGNAGERWKSHCRRGMRSARLSVVNDPSRIELQRQYARLDSNALVIVHPGCFRDFHPVQERRTERVRLGIPDNACVLVASGHINEVTYGDWLLKTLPRLQDDEFLLMQPGAITPILQSCLEQISQLRNLRFVRGQMTCRESWASMSVADIGFVGYRHDGPQFQNMGVSSTRLCMFLQSGLPVIAVRQPSFEFLEEHRCGVLIDDISEIPGAIQHIRTHLSEMSANATAAIKAVGKMTERYAELVKTIAEISKCPR